MKSVLEQFENKKMYGVFDSDLDGVSARLVAELYIKPVVQSFDVLNTAKREMNEFDMDVAMRNDIILFCDIAPTPELYKLLIESKKDVYIFDHHQSSYDQLNSIVKENYYFSIEKCGTKIIYSEVTKGKKVPRPLAQYIELVDTYDRWQQDSMMWKDARSLHNLMYGCVDWKANLSDSYKYNNFMNIQKKKFEEQSCFFFTTYEKSLIAKAEQKERANLTEARNNLKVRMDNSGNIYGYTECSSKLSYVLGTILKERPQLKYIIGHSTWLEKAKGERNGRVSLRSLNDFDVSVIGVAWGGGGHPQATGIDLKYEDFVKLKNGGLHLI